MGMRGLKRQRLLLPDALKYRFRFVRKAALIHIRVHFHGFLLYKMPRRLLLYRLAQLLVFRTRIEVDLAG